MSAAVPMMPPSGTTLDLSYRSSALLNWASARLKLYGITLAGYPDADPEILIGANRESKTLFLPSGHDIDTAYHLVSRGVAHLYNPAWAREFVRGPAVGNVVPFPRRSR